MKNFVPKTFVSIEGDKFHINGTPTLKNRSFNGVSIEGLLMNSRMANAVFDDENEFTKHLWAYPDTGEWDPERNTNELISMMPIYASNGLVCICINLQGASPVGYYRSDKKNLQDLMEKIHSQYPDVTEKEVWQGLPGIESQPWNSGGFKSNGNLKSKFMARAAKIIEKADSLNMIVCLGFFYFGQDERLRDSKAVKRALHNATQWVLEKNYRNVIVEINNECDSPKYEHSVLRAEKVHELIVEVSKIQKDNNKLLVGTSFTRRMPPTDKVIDTSDFILLHGNGMNNPSEIRERIIITRESSYFRGQPILFNEDDHFDFENSSNNTVSALTERTGWGFFDPGPGAGGYPAYSDYVFGYQNIPINWTINTPRKKSFFQFLSKL